MIQKTILIEWHGLSWEQAVKKLGSDVVRGLSQKNVEKKQVKFGKNLLPQEKSLSKLKILLDQFKSPLIYILVFAGIVVLFFREFTDAIVIFGAVFLNTIVGYIQETKASQALRELKKIVKVQARVIREGNIKMINSTELVSGDIILLSSGDKIPADARIIENYGLKTNEMSLTGEWLSAEKKIEPLNNKTPLADRDNMVYMGTTVEYGKAKAMVVSIGIETEIGKVARLVKETKEEKTPLQKKLSRFSKIIGTVIAVISIIIFVEGIIVGNDAVEMFTVAVAVAVAAIPEGLPIAMTVILALGMQRILKRKGLARKLLAAETLGSTSVIATDKTLTLTEGKMKVSQILTGTELLNGKKENHSLALKIITLVNEAFIENPEQSIEKWIVQGQPTDKALLLAGMEAGFNKKELEKKMNSVFDYPFDSINKYSVRVFSSTNKENISYITGAPEKLLEKARYLKIGSQEKVLTKQMKKTIKHQLDKLAENGLRVVAAGYKKEQVPCAQKQKLKIKYQNDKSKIKNDLLDDMVFVGLVAMKDPVRKGVKKAIKICRQAGLRTIIVTGDHKLTAKAVAQEIGFDIKEKNIIEGKDLDELSDKEFKEIIKDIKIYARVEPKHKMRIVQTWQDMGEVVAMTGDGINDAPALKKADIGVSLGSGSEVAKEVSDLVLLTDNFNIIIAAIEEGRAIIDNIRKVITYLVSDAFTEIVLIGVSIFFGFPLPVSAVQILWVNLIEDGFPAIALSFEPKDKDIMKQKPKGHDIPLLTREMKIIIFIIGLITNVILLGLFFWLWNQNHDITYIRTMVFAGLTISSLFYIFSCKNLQRNIWHINIFSNKFLIFSWLFGMIMLVVAVYLPPLQVLLKTVPLGFNDWFIIVGLGLIELILIEGTKWHFIVKSKTKN